MDIWIFWKICVALDKTKKIISIKIESIWFGLELCFYFTTTFTFRRSAIRYSISAFTTFMFQMHRIPVLFTNNWKAKQVLSLWQKWCSTQSTIDGDHTKQYYQFAVIVISRKSHMLNEIVLKSSFIKKVL